MITSKPTTLSPEEFAQVFEHVSPHAQHDYLQEIAAQKCQLFLLEFEEKTSWLITSVSKVYGVTFLNVLELAGDFGYASYPAEFLEFLKAKAKAVNADEIRVIAARLGSGKMLKEYGFTLEYAEYGLRVK